MIPALITMLVLSITAYTAVLVSAASGRDVVVTENERLRAYAEHLLNDRNAKEQRITDLEALVRRLTEAHKATHDTLDACRGQGGPP